VDRLLAAGEAAEDEEVGDLYKRPTGDPATETLLRDIRKEERAHSHTVSELRAGSGDGAGASTSRRDRRWRHLPGGPRTADVATR
jgi:hypothetical protein